MGSHSHSTEPVPPYPSGGYGCNFSSLLGSGPILVTSGEAWYLSYFNYRGETHCYAVSASHVGTPPPLLPALHVPQRDCGGDMSRGSSRWRTRQPPPSGTR